MKVKLLKQLKDLSKELGKIPTRAEWRKVYGSGDEVIREFGNWGEFVGDKSLRDLHVKDTIKKKLEGEDKKEYKKELLIESKVEILRNAIRESVDNLPTYKFKQINIKGLAKTRPHVSLTIDISDVHIGALVINSSLNAHSKEIMLKKIDKYFEDLTKLIEFKLRLFEIDEVVFVFLGDILEGFHIFKSQSWRSDLFILDQLIWGSDIFAIKLAEFLTQFKKYTKFKFRGVYGNHGRFDHDAPLEGNYDYLFYDRMVLRLKTLGIDFIDVNFPRDWFQLFKIYKQIHLLTHGSEVNFVNRIPYFNLSTIIERYQSLLGNFIDYAHLAHCHDEAELPSSIGTVLLSGNWVGTTELSRFFLKFNIPVQKVYTFDPEYGLICSDRIYLTTPDLHKPKIIIK